MFYTIAISVLVAVTISVLIVVGWLIFRVVQTRRRTPVIHDWARRDDSRETTPSPTPTTTSGIDVDLTLNPPRHTPKGNSGREPEPLPPCKWKKGTFRIIYWAVIIPLGMISVFVLEWGILSGLPLTWNTLLEFNATSVGLTLVVLWVAYFLDTFKIVKFNELGGRVVLGSFESYSDGITLAPRWITDLVKVTRATEELDQPHSDPSKIFWGDLSKLPDGKIPDGMVLPIRVPFLQRSSDEDFEVRWPLETGEVKTRITKGYDLLSATDAPVEYSIGIRFIDIQRVIVRLRSLKAAYDLATDYAETLITGTLQKMSAAEAQVLKQEISVHLEEQTDNRVFQSYGFVIDFVTLKSIGTSHTIAESRAQAAAAVNLANKTVRDAKATAKATELQGASVAGAELALLNARSVGLRNIVDAATSRSGGVELAKAMEAARAIQFGADSTVVVPGGNTGDGLGLFGAAVGTAISASAALGRKPAGEKALTETQPAQPTTTTTPPARGDRRGHKKGGKRS
ncbi:MAG: hypothetical protein WAX44_00830 [Minisyncoccia bacterium]